jgi:hypothetical protein
MFEQHRDEILAKHATSVAQSGLDLNRQ